MAATAVTTVTSPQMVFSRENNKPLIKIKIARQNFWSAGIGLVATMKSRHASRTDARFVSQLLGDLRDQRIRYLYFRAPARAFVWGVCAKLTVIRLTAQRTSGGIERF
jgi:hypothetical protein